MCSANDRWVDGNQDHRHDATRGGEAVKQEDRGQAEDKATAFGGAKGGAGAIQANL